jgi:hypothetical protein
MASCGVEKQGLRDLTGERNVTRRLRTNQRSGHGDLPPSSFATIGCNVHLGAARRALKILRSSPEQAVARLPQNEAYLSAFTHNLRFPGFQHYTFALSRVVPFSVKANSDFSSLFVAHPPANHLPGIPHRNRPSTRWSLLLPTRL